MIVSFTFNLYNTFFPSDKKHKGDWNYFCWPLLWRSKDWGQDLTLTEVGLVVHIAQTCGSQCTDVIHTWHIHRSISAKHRPMSVACSLEKFQQLGIISDLQIDSKKEREKERKKGKLFKIDDSLFTTKQSSTSGGQLTIPPVVTEKKSPKSKPGQGDFDAVYKNYRRKEGKSKGYAIFLKEVKTDEDLKRFQRAVERYNEHLDEHRTEEQFIKHFSTFMREWRDWAEMEKSEWQKAREELFAEEYADPTLNVVR